MKKIIITVTILSFINLIDFYYQEQMNPSDINERWCLFLNFTPLLYGMLGAAVGCLIGYLLSDIFPIMSVSQTEYELPFSEKDIKGLREVTRYKDD